MLLNSAAQIRATDIPKLLSKVIEIALKNVNTITGLCIYGKGGYGKTAATKDALKELGVQYYEFHVNPSHGTNIITGSIIHEDFAKGRITYNTDSSILNRAPVLVLEEGFDLNPSVLETLKASMTGGYICVNDVCQPVTTKLIIVLTNKNPQQLVSTAHVTMQTSLRAFFSRFYTVELVGPSNSKEYLTSILPYAPEGAEDEIKSLIKMFEEAGETLPSPRSMISLAKALREGLSPAFVLPHNLLEIYNKLISKTPLEQLLELLDKDDSDAIEVMKAYNNCGGDKGVDKTTQAKVLTYVSKQLLPSM